MELNYPKYPFLWNYNDMFFPIDYNTKSIKNDHNEEISRLSELFPNKNIIEINQKILLENIDKLILNIQTTYLAKLECFESDEFNLKLITNYKINYKKDVPVFVYDPYNNLKTEEYNKKNICIVKNFKIIEENVSNIPTLYIRTHTIKGIIRFSPSNNSFIKFKNNKNPIFYTVTEFSIILHNIITCV
jgi:hypothetical protein